MFFANSSEYLNAPRKSVALFGLSGVGKTYVSNKLRANGDWFHYSVDYRIGTHYLGMRVADVFKHEAMKNPLLREMLMSDSIYIASNITFENLAPLSCYLGKPGNPDVGGLPFDEYITRQRQHRHAEISSMADAELFAERAHGIYGYPHFLCDTSGSLCEVIDPRNDDDPVVNNLADNHLILYIEGSDDHAEKLAKRFDAAPKPIYYNESFLTEIWNNYLKLNDISADDVVPDDFIRWGYRQQLAWRMPRYKMIAEKWGYTVSADEISKASTVDDFNDLISRAIDRKNKV